MLIVAWMILFLFYYTYINLKKVSMKIKAKFSSISIKTCTYLLIFSVFFFHQMLPPRNIKLQLDFHIDHKQIKEIPGKIRQLRDYYIYFECIVYFWCTGLQIFSGKFLTNIYPNLNAIFAFVFISTCHIVNTYLSIWYFVFRYFLCIIRLVI